MEEAATTARKMDIFHNDSVGYWLFVKGKEQQDCLGRSTLLQCLDEVVGCPKDDDLIVLRRNPPHFDLDLQDLLGRTALHIACEKGWTLFVEVLLELGADPGVVTVFGHLPLHYAATANAQEATSLCNTKGGPNIKMQHGLQKKLA